MPSPEFGHDVVAHHRHPVEAAEYAVVGQQGYVEIESCYILSHFLMLEWVTLRQAAPIPADVALPVEGAEEEAEEDHNLTDDDADHHLSV